MHPAMASQQTVSSDSQSARKRRRSGPPDWESFYKNGLPHEVIVIEDSPDRDAHKRFANGGVANGSGGGYDGSKDISSGSVAAYHYDQNEHLANGSDDRHIAKKRRRQDDALPSASSLIANSSGSRYDPVHNYVQHSSGSTISSERTHSNSRSSLYTTNTAVNTAATSQSSTNGRIDYDLVGQKRKRTTRQQAANESKKRDREVAAVSLTYTNYRPPPLPPLKAQEVEVKVIRDVSALLWIDSLAIAVGCLAHLLTLHTRHRTRRMSRSMTRMGIISSFLRPT